MWYAERHCEDLNLEHALAYQREGEAFLAEIGHEDCDSYAASKVGVHPNGPAIFYGICFCFPTRDTYS